MEKAIFERRDDDIETRLEIAVSPEDDAEVRRVSLTNRSERPREIELTSYVEIALGTAGGGRRPPRLRKALRRDRMAAGEHGARGAPASARAERTVALRLPRPVHRRPRAGAGRVGNRPDAISGPGARSGRPARSRRPGAFGDDGRRARPDLQPEDAGPARARWVRAPVVHDGDRRRRGPRRAPSPQKYHEPGVAARTFALAYTHAQVSLGTSASRSKRRSFSSGSARASSSPTGRCAPTRRRCRSNTLGQSGLWRHGISGDLPIVLVRVRNRDDLPLVRQVLKAQEHWRLKGLKADAVILNEHPDSYRDEMHQQLTQLVDGGPWGAWKGTPGGVFLLRADGMPEAERDASQRGRQRDSLGRRRES